MKNWRGHGLMVIALCALVVYSPMLLAEKQNTKNATHHAKANVKKTDAKKADAKKSKDKKQDKKSTSKTAKKHVVEGAKKGNAKAKVSKEAETSPQDLTRLQEEIRTTQNRIELTKAEREKKEIELKSAEKEITKISSNLTQVEQNVNVKETHLQELQRQKSELLFNKEKLLNSIALDIQMAQRQKNQDYYKLLLNQEDPQKMMRMMRYYGFIQQARATRVQEFNQTLQSLQTVAQEEQQNMDQLQSLKTELSSKQTQLSVAQQQRNNAIKALSARLESDQERIERLKQDEQALRNVMERLAREAQAREQREQREAEQRREQELKQQQEQRKAAVAQNKTPPKPPVVKPVEVLPEYKLQAHKGRCALPASGGIRSSFGSARAGGLKWNGVTIAAAAGSTVKSIKPGKVVFADFLRGYGFLLILDHGRGLMSLYGQNQNLLKKVGDTVAANENIATVGEGGADANGLYFEIRLRGRANDPLNWCAYQ